MISHGRSGETSSASIVPVSFSRVSEMAVISDEMIVSTNAIRPGTNRFELSRVGLKRMRTSGAMTMRDARATDGVGRGAAARAGSRRSPPARRPAARLPVFGSVASVTIRICAGSPRPRSAAKPGSNTIASCACAGLKQRFEIRRARHDGDGAEDAGGGKPIAQRHRGVVRRGIDDRQAHVVDIGANGEAEQHDLHDRQRDEHDQRPAIAQDVERLLAQQPLSALMPRVSDCRPREPDEQLVDRVDAELLLQLRRRAHRRDAARRP